MIGEHLSSRASTRHALFLALTAIAAATLLISDSEARAQTPSVITLSVTSGSPYILEGDPDSGEYGGRVTITATLDAPAPENVGVQIGHHNIEDEPTASNFDDYRTLLPSFSKGQQTTTFMIIAKTDEIDEADEIIELAASLRFPTSEISAETQTPLRLIIVDDDGDPSSDTTPSHVTLTADDYNPDEGDTVTITATLDHPAGEDGVQVTISASDQSTASSDDYTLPTSPITIAENATSGTATITIADDSVDDDNEILVLDATATDITANGTTLIIADNDDPPVVDTPPLSDVATLSALVLNNAADSSNIAFTPTFDVDTTSYSANVDTTVSQVTITPTTTHTSATVTISGDTVSSGSPSNALDIAHGSNVIFVVVTAEDSETIKAYSIDVNRPNPPPPPPPPPAPSPVPAYSPATSPPTTLALTADPQNPAEGDTVTITATINEPAPANGTTVTLNVDTTSTADSDDYTLASTTINIAENTTSGTTTISIIDDTQSESEETIAINATSTNPSLNSNTINISIADNDPVVESTPTQSPAAPLRNNSLILRIQPAFHNITVAPRDRVVLNVHVYGRQNIRDDSLADDLNLEWEDDTTGTFRKPKGLTALYHTPQQTGRYTVTATLPEPELNCYSFLDDEEQCEATFNITVRRTQGPPQPEEPPVNPTGHIPDTIDDAQGVSYKVFTPVEGGSYTHEDTTFTAPPSAVPDNQIIGINITKTGPVDNNEKNNPRHKLAGYWYRVQPVDKAGQPLNAYRLEKPAQICLPLPDELRSTIADVSIAQAQHSDGNLTILSSNLIITIDGPIVCANTTALPINAAIAITAENAPQLPPAPIFQTPDETLPETGGIQPPHPTILILTIILALTALITAFTIARQPSPAPFAPRKGREQAKRRERGMPAAAVHMPYSSPTVSSTNPTKSPSISSQSCIKSNVYTRNG